MNLFGGLLGQAFNRVLDRFGFVKIPGGLGSISTGGFLGFTNLGNRRKQLEAYQSHVYKCVTLIYRRAISVPMKLHKERGDKDEEIKQHPFIDLMQKPNPHMTGRDLKATTFMHKDLAGMAFWLMVFNGLGRPAEIWPLQVANFNRFLFNEAGTEFMGYEFRSDMGKMITYSPEEIVYFRYPHPLYMFEGASPIQAMAFAYDTDLAIRTYQRRFFQNSARPDVMLETEQKIDPADAKRILMALKAAHQGVDKSWEPAIMDQGLKANVLSVAAKDFEFAKLAGWTKEDILEAYNVPEGKLGTVKNVNKANALGIDITFNSECIAPRLDSYEETITNKILPYYDTGLLAKHVSCIPRDLEHDLKERESNLKSKFTTINEEREKEGMEPVPWGDSPFVLISEIQYGEEAGIRQESESRIQNSEEKREIAAPSGLAMTKDRKENARLLHERKVAARSRVFRVYVRRFFKAQQAGVLDRLGQYYPRIEGAIAGMSARKVAKWLDAHKDLADQINFDISVANSDLIEGCKPYIEGTLLMGGEDALSMLDSGIDFDLYSRRVIDFMDDKEMLIKDINRVTHDAIAKELRAGFQAGESIEDIAKRMRKVFGHADKTRSLRIAQTETNSAANFGNLEGYKQSGVVEGKEWIAGSDARPTHQEAAARYSGDGAIPLDEDFQVGAGRGPGPGNIGLAEEDINCRCAMLPVVRE